MRRVEVRTQAELDAALAESDILPICVGNGRFIIRGSSHVVARGSSHVVARESSHVEAWESSHVEAWGSSHVVAHQLVAIHKLWSHVGTVDGGILIEVPKIDTTEKWIEWHGLEVDDGTVTLYKAVQETYETQNGVMWNPGLTPECDDWDPEPICGGGLHFSPTPRHALRYRTNAERFIGCHVRLSELVVHAEDSNKAKAPRVAGPVWEVDRYGNPIESDSQEAQDES